MAKRNQAGHRPRPSIGKGDSPRNVGPKFRENYGAIDWGHGKKPKGGK